MKTFGQIRSILPLLFFVVLGWALHRCRGQYDGRALWAIIAAFLAALCGFNAKPSRLFESGKSRYSIFAAAVLITLLFFMTWLFKDALVIYADVPSDIALMYIFIEFGWFLSLMLILRLVSKRKSLSIPWLATLFSLTLLVAKFFALQSSPHPGIDVFSVPTQAADFFLSGKNPYTQTYIDIYKGTLVHYPAAFDYWPGDLYIESFFRAVCGDVRVASLFSDFGTAICIHRILIKFKKTELAWTLPLLWIAFPCSFFVLEQAWIDPILLFFGALFTLFVVDRRWLRAGIALGVFCTVKQYAIFFALFALILSFRDPAPKRAAGRLIAGSLGAFAAILLPFALWDWSAFYERTIQMILRQEMRTDALTLTAWFQFLHLPPITSGISMAASGLATLFGCFAILRAKENPLHAFFCSVTLTYGVVFLLGKQAFCNYYYLLAGLVLLQIVSGLGRAEPKVSQC